MRRWGCVQLWNLSRISSVSESRTKLTFCGYLPGMTLHVSLQVALLGKGFATQGAGETVVLVVSPQVSLHVAPL